MTGYVVGLVLAVVAATLLTAKLRPGTAESVVGVFKAARVLSAAVFLLIFSATALQSGRWYLVFAALLAIAVATLYLFVEQPHRGVA